MDDDSRGGHSDGDVSTLRGGLGERGPASPDSPSEGIGRGGGHQGLNDGGGHRGGGGDRGLRGDRARPVGMPSRFSKPVQRCRYCLQPACSLYTNLSVGIRDAGMECYPVPCHERLLAYSTSERPILPKPQEPLDEPLGLRLVGLGLK